MTEQEKLKEDLYELIKKDFIGNWLLAIPTRWLIDKIFKYLHSKDVVIKVKGKLPEDFVGISYLSGSGGVIKSVWVDEDKLKEAGYGFFEPLIEKK